MKVQEQTQTPSQLIRRDQFNPAPTPHNMDIDTTPKVSYNEECIRIELRELGGVLRFDIRRCLRSSPKNRVLPTARGVSIPPDKIHQVIQALTVAAEKKGPIYIDL